MFKIIFFGAFVLATAFAVNIEEFENLIEYAEPPYRSLLLPYPYQEDRDERVIVKPLHDALVPVVPKVPATAVGFSAFGLVAKIASTAIAVTKKAIVFILANAPALVIGTLVAFGICKFTPICAKLSTVKSLLEVPLELRSYATPERLARATDFVKTAIRKYRSLQNEN